MKDNYYLYIPLHAIWHAIWGRNEWDKWIHNGEYSWIVVVTTLIEWVDVIKKNIYIDYKDNYILFIWSFVYNDLF